jgi:hypothetical protein
MNNINPKFILTCPNCGTKQIYVGTGLTYPPICCRCTADLQPCTDQTTTEKINTIYSSLDLRIEFGNAINHTLEDICTADEDLADFVCEAYKRNNVSEMFTAIVGRDLDDIIDRMNTLPVEAEREAAE